MSQFLLVGHLVINIEMGMKKIYCSKRKRPLKDISKEMYFMHTAVILSHSIESLDFLFIFFPENRSMLKK